MDSCKGCWLLSDVVQSGGELEWFAVEYGGGGELEQFAAVGGKECCKEEYEGGGLV